MDELIQTINMDFPQLILNIIVILVALIFVVGVLEKASVIIGKPFKWIKKNDDDHQLLVDAISTIKSMQETHAADKKEVTDKNTTLETVLSDFMTEVKNDIKQFTDNRVHDREQSFEIQQKLTDSIQTIVNNNKNRDVQINALIDANKEMLAEKINEKYKYYIKIDGIPADEYDEFVSLHKAYNGVGGNHHGDAKFEYCMEHLPIISVETKLVYKGE